MLIISVNHLSQCNPIGSDHHDGTRGHLLIQARDHVTWPQFDLSGDDAQKVPTTTRWAHSKTIEFTL